MIMAFDFRVNFLRLQLGGGQACTLVRDLNMYSFHLHTCRLQIPIPHDDHLKINNFKGSTIIANLRGDQF